MPRRIVGSANYGLYASLTKKTRKTFLRLIAAIIYGVSTDELAGTLRASGIDTRKKRQGKYQLVAKIWLTDTVIAVQATDFTGPDDDDDEDDRNDQHDICQFEFERERGQWRLAQVSGPRLPTPETVNRASSAAGSPEAKGIFVATSNVAARITSQIGSNLRSMLAATGSYLRRKRPNIPVGQPDAYSTAFISYARTVNTRNSTQIYEPHYSSHPLSGTTTVLSWASTIARVILRGAEIIRPSHPQPIEPLLFKTEHSVLTLLTQDKKLLLLLIRNNTMMNTDAFAHMETLSQFPERSRKLLANLLKLNTKHGASVALSRTNRATWNSLIARPLAIICAHRIMLNVTVPIELETINTSRKNKAVRSSPAGKLPAHDKALPRQRDHRCLPRQDADTHTLP